MNRLFEEIEKFRMWAKDYSDIAEEDRGGDWEIDYSNWPIIWKEFEKFLQESDHTKWTSYQLDSILYIIGRDNECNSIIELIAKDSDTLQFIAERALSYPSQDTKWQITELLHMLNNKMTAEQLVEKYIAQNIEYVTRMGIKTLGRLRSGLTEKYCERSWQWDQNDPMSEYQRMMVLTVLFESGSELTPKYLLLAKEDGRKYLVGQAEKIEDEINAGNSG